MLNPSPFISLTAVGKFISDVDIVKYKKKPTFTVYSGEVLNATEPDAYRNLVEKRSVKFFVEVAPRALFDVTIGLIEYQLCDGNNSIKVTAGGVKTVVNPVLDGAPCNTAIEYTIPAVSSSKKGRISFKLTGKSIVSVATLCVTRHLLTPSSNCVGNEQCETFDGCGDYTVINSTAAIPGSPCDVMDTSFATLNILEQGVFIRKAILQWSGSGYPKSDQTGVVLNGRNISSTLLYKSNDFEPYYGAFANSMDVTDIVREFGYVNQDYVVANIFHRKWHSCPQAHIAAWSLTVMYEKIELPNARINLCTENMVSNRKVYNFSIGCIVPWPTVPEHASARATLVAIETDDTITERLEVNDKLIGFNQLKEMSGEGFDVLELNVTDCISTWDNLTFSFSNDTAHDVMTLAVMNSYQTLGNLTL